MKKLISKPLINTFFTGMMQISKLRRIALGCIVLMSLMPNLKGNLSDNFIPDSLESKAFLPTYPSFSELSKLSPDYLRQSAQSNSDFSIQLMNGIVKDNKDGKLRNVVVSPFFLEIGLSLMYNGAEAKTKEQIMTVLRQKPETMDEFSLENMLVYENVNKLASEKYVFNHSSHVWVDDKLGLQDGFANLAKEKFGTLVTKAELHKHDIAAKLDTEFEVESQNDFPKILKTIPPNSKMVVVIAQFFQGFWKKRFKEMGLTDFTLISGDAKPMPMMYQVGSFEYLEDEYCKGARIPFNNTDFVMEIFVPKANDGIKSIESKLNATQLKKWRDAFQPKKGTVVLPIFSIAARQNLMGVLAGMGFTAAFSEANATFPGITKSKTARISKFTSGSVIDIKPDGTPVSPKQDLEDAKISKLPSAFYVKADHPFFFVIRKTTEDKILFMGLVIKPRDSIKGKQQSNSNDD